MFQKSFTPRRILLVFLGILLIAVIGVRFYVGSSSKRSLLPSMGQVPEFSLVTESRQTFTRDNLIGKVTIADFIFTTCAGPCPLMSAKMQQLQDELEAQPKIQLVSFSVDPEYDTPSVLAEYAKQFGAKQGRWLFLTGSKETIHLLARKGFHLAVEEDKDAILHSAKFILIDEAGIIRGYYDSEDEESMNRLLTDVESVTQR